MKRFKFTKRITSFLLATMMAVSGWGGILVSVAADAYYIRFYDNTTKATATNTTLVEGAPITIQANLPPAYSFSSTPFSARLNRDGNSDPVNILEHFQIVTNTTTRYSLTPLEFNGNSNLPGYDATLAPGAVANGNATYVDARENLSSEYTLEALYTANVTEGNATLSYKTVVPAGETPKSGYNSLQVVSNNAIPITSDSTITFEVAEDQTSADSIVFGPVLSDAKGPTGYFKGKYEGQAVAANAITGSGAKRYIPVTIYARAVDDEGKKVDPLTLSFNIYLAGLPANVLLAKGSQITVSFTRQTITPLIATVISREKALEDTKNSILQNPTNADTTTTGESYITLSGDETLQSIQSNFTVLSQIHRHNIDVDIDWTWKADNELYKDYVKIEKVANPRHKAIEIRNRPENDFTGSLNFVIKYTYTVNNQKVVLSSKEGTIPVTFYGTGKPPRVMPMQSHTGQQGAEDKIETVTEFTQTMNLDVYTGNPAYADKDLWDDAPTAPYKLTTSLYYGDGRGRAEYAIIYQNSAGGEFEVYLDGTAIPYKFGEKIENIGNYRAIEILAKKRGQSFFRVEFYNAKKELMGQNIFSQNFYIEDSTPNDDGTLESLILTGKEIMDSKKDIFKEVYPNNIIDFGFKPDQNAYNIKLPYCVKSVIFTPKVTSGSGASNDIYVSTQPLIPDPNDPSKQISKPVESGGLNPDKLCEPIELKPETSKTVKITVTAQDGSTNSYTITLLRVGPSSDAELSSFEAYPDTDPKTNLITGFAPKTYDYEVTVPYSTKQMTVWAVPNCPWVVPSEADGGQKYTVEWKIMDTSIGTGSSPQTISLMTRIANFFKNSSIEPSRTFNINRPKKENGVFPESATTEITATVTAEDGSTKRVYKLTVTCMAPSTDNLLQSLSVSDINGNSLPFEFNAQFRPDLKEYLVRIPYSTREITITTQARDDATSRGLELKLDGLYDSANGRKNDNSVKKFDIVPTPEHYNPAIPTTFLVKNMAPVEFKQSDPDPNLKPIHMDLIVEAESEDKTYPPYRIEFQRNDPSDDSRLKSLTLTDQDGVTIPTFSFNAEQLEYDIEVPFLTSQVIATPVQSFHLSTVTVNDKEITKTQPSFTTGILPAGGVYKMTIVVTAENFSQRTYIINIHRDKPSDEARLSALSVGALKLDPKFSPNTLKYDVVIPEGTNGMVVTPTAASPYATITVDKMACESGKPSHQINPLEAHSKVHIVVTAQDGKTKNTYILSVTDENLITKSDNADLYSLAVVTADLNPKFNSSVTEYEAYVKDDVYSVDIIPKTANRYAKVTVFAERREIGDYDENYAVSLFDDETEITVEVVSQDEKVTKEYTVTIYRGDEEKQGKYDPITAEEVDFTVADPIKIDITKYPLVAADVFNTLKTDYPDKSILFTGNDYTLSIKGSDMDTLVPNTEFFDLSITFSPPNEDEIWDTITDLDSGNDDLAPVFIHFNHHGTLPAPMKLTISLGSAYRNRELFWNYYNEERNRIDYYGFVLSNAKGSFALPLTHMSTYIVTEDRIIEAENKVGAMVGYDTPGAPESLSKYFTDKKPNPNTGAGVK